MEVSATFSQEEAPPWSFNQHHLNFIAIYTLSPSYRVFSEVEYEHGPSLGDSASSGKIYLAKGYLEFKRSDALRVRVGKFLSPFGIYNERHDATPTFLTTRLAHSVYDAQPLATGLKDRLFAKFTTGVQLVGDFYPGRWEIRYHLYVGNGRGEDPGGSDDNSNKGLGCRIVISPPVAKLQLGMSLYADRHGHDNDTQQRSLGLDTEFDFGSLHGELELLNHWSELIDLFEHPDGKFRHYRGFYILLAYRIGDKFTPCVRFGRANHDVDVSGASETTGMVGLNIAFTPRVYLKNELYLHRDRRQVIGSTYSVDRYGTYLASVAVAF